MQHGSTASPEQDPHEPDVDHDAFVVRGRALLTVVTVALIVSVAIAVLVGSAIAVHGSAGPIWFDAPLSDWAVQHRTATMDRFFTAVTSLGYAPWSTIMMAFVVVAAVLRRRADLAVLMALSVVGVTTASPLLKNLFDRPRPDPELWLVHTSSYSFPSGHAMHSIGSWIMAAVVITLLVRRLWIRVSALVCAVVLVLLIGASRVYLGVHWPTDVLGGWAFATAWVSLLLLGRAGAMTLFTSCAGRSATRR